MEGLNKLVELEYINAAVNSIGKIEGLKRCESLLKIDLTLNFVEIEDLKESMENLDWCPKFSELYMTGNPCTDWPHYRKYVIAKCTSLQRLDGNDVTKSERLEAKTNLKKLEVELEKVADASLAKKFHEKKEGIYDSEKYTRENRWNWYVDERDRKEKEEKDRTENSMFKDYNDQYGADVQVRLIFQKQF